MPRNKKKNNRGECAKLPHCSGLVPLDVLAATVVVVLLAFPAY